MFAEINPADANDLGIKDGQWIWLEGPEGGRIKVKAMLTRRVAKGVVFSPYHFGGWFEGRDLVDNYPRRHRTVGARRSCQQRVTYGYDSVTAMQETKCSLCKLTPA